MKPKRINHKVQNRLLPLLVVPVIFLVAGLCFDFYYQLNDDVVIKDILSGAFSGLPDGHTNQILYPLGWLISLGYRILPGIPIYPLFLLSCYGICFYLLGYRSVQYYQRLWGKLLLLLLEAGIFLSLFLWELVYVQYSVVCGLLGATACFWFYTTKQDLSPGSFWLSNLPALLLIWLAFLVRSEMLLLLTPFIAVMGIYHWSEEVSGGKENNHFPGKDRLWKRLFSKENCCKYIAFVLVAALGCLAFWGLDEAAYTGTEWRLYRQFFDARTRVYDYTWYPSYEENQAFYESIGVSSEQFRLIDSYNFGLDEEIDANTLVRIASFGEKASRQGSLLTRLKNGIREMVLRMIDPGEGPYNYFVLTAYGMVIALAILQKKKSYIWKLLLLAFAHSISWMYLLLADRVVARIAHPLYVLEFLCLLALLVKEFRDRPLWNAELYYRRGALAVFFPLVIISGAVMFPRVAEEQTRRQRVNESMEAFQAYAAKEEESYYYFDVYSTVYFTEKLFAQNGEKRKNYDILGGWFNRSPLQKGVVWEYAKEAGITISQALLTDNFYFVAERQGDMSPVLLWYEAAEAAVEVKEVTALGRGENPLVVYQLRINEE